MSEIIYRLRQLTKQYDGRRVLDVNQLDIQRSEILALVGPSGSGKSTLLRLLNFLEPPSSGAIEFLGAPFTPNKLMPLTLRRRVTMVFQRSILLNRSVKANVRYSYRLHGHRNSNGLIDTTLADVGLADLVQQNARKLSGGEAQRVALARAMVLQPDVLLLDEPTANLDPYNVHMIEEILFRLNQQTGTTLVLVTHNVFQARRLAQRVALILDGRLIEIARVDEFFAAPRDERTAAFIRGDMVY